MNILFSTLLMILTMLLIFLPFVRKSHTTTAAFSNGQSSESITELTSTKPPASVSSGYLRADKFSIDSTKKELIFSTLGEIEFDYHMDKLSREDYQELKNNYAHMAVEVLKAENSNIHAEDDISLSKYNLQEIEAEIEKELASQEFCHACGDRQN